MPRSRCVLALVIGVATLAWPVHADEPPPFKAGFAERDITPEIGMERPGGYGKSYVKSIHDPCKVRAAVFDDGNKRAALVGIDALGIRRQTVEKVRAAIHAQCGIEPDAILLAASHSHSSGPMCWILPGEFDHASPLVQRLAYEKSTIANPKYLELVERQLVAAVCEADKNRAAARCGIGRGKEATVAYNRRFRMRDGLTFTHPGAGNPDIVEPAGPIDPEVGVIGAWDAEGRCLGCVVNFACHATLDPAPGAASANYVYYLEKAIQGYLGKDCVVVFLNGASGDVTQVDNLTKTANRTGDRWAQFVGGSVGAEALKVLLEMEPGSLAPVDYRMKVLEIKRRVPRPERVSRSLEIAAKEPKEVGQDAWTWAKEIVLLDDIVKREPTDKAEVQAIQVGPAVFISDPAEFFCQLGLDIKAGSPFPFTFPVSLANGDVGYVPTEEAFGPRGGGYETRLTSYSNLEPTAGPQMVQAGLELARQLQPGPIPTRPPAKPYTKGAWSYGNVPPELD